MNRMSTKMIMIINLICLPVNVYTCHSGWNAWHRGDHIGGAMFMLLGVVCFFWVGWSAILQARKLLTKD